MMLADELRKTIVQGGDNGCGSRVKRSEYM